MSVEKVLKQKQNIPGTSSLILKSTCIENFAAKNCLLQRIIADLEKPDNAWLEE